MSNEQLVFRGSPFKNTLQSFVGQIQKSANKQNNEENKVAIENALYFSVQKRMLKREHLGGDNEYLTGLLGDINAATYEFEQVCYYNSLSMDVFSQLKSKVMSLLVND